MSNATAKSVIETYLKIDAPGYALLIDAPWGAGKTHFIKDVIQNSASDAVYVTLYDIHSTDAFDWALIRATNTLSRGKFGKAFDMLTGAVGNMRAGDENVNLGNLGKAAFTEYALRKLPNTLIFDDIERCGLKPKQISGLINRFVEHQKKSVILLANVEKIPKGGEAKQTQGNEQGFDVTREKLIGQTVTLKPDLDAALPSVWGKIADGQGKTVLQARQHLIKETFEEAGHQNLRLILRAVRDCAVMLNALTEEMLKFEDSVDRLIRTHLALHMAYHGGQLRKHELNAPPGNWNRIIAEQNGQEPPAKSQHEQRFEKVVQDHPKADIDSFGRGVFPGKLRQLLFVDGYAKPAEILRQLKDTQLFQAPQTRTDSFRMMSWHRETQADLRELLQQVDEQITRYKISKPADILCVFYAKRDLVKYGWPDHSGLVESSLDYVQRLTDQSKLPAKRPDPENGRFVYGFEEGGGQINFSYKPVDSDDQLADLTRKLRDGMDAAYDKELPGMTAQLLQSLRQGDLAAFGVHDNPDDLNFSYVPVLHQIDKTKFAETFLYLFEKDKERASNLLDELAKRLRTPHLSDEHEWIGDIAGSIIEQARAKDLLLAAQVMRVSASYLNTD